MEHHPSHDKESNKRNPEDAAQRNHGWFQFGPWVFSVDRGLQVIAERPRPTHRLPVEAWAQFYGFSELDNENFIPLIAPGPGFDRDYAMTTDLSEPVLVATLRGREGHESPLLIDGTHRLYRAYVEGVPHLPAYLLTLNESMAILEGLRLK